MSHGRQKESVIPKMSMSSLSRIDKNIFYLLSFFFSFFLTQDLPAEEEIFPSGTINQISSVSSEEISKDPTPSNANIIPRTILSIFYNELNEEIRDHPSHLFFDMPLNHLGLRVKYWNLAHGLPQDIPMDEVRGILAYFDTNMISDPLGFINWANEQIQQGKKFVLIGTLGFYQNKEKEKVPSKEINNFLKNLGLQLSQKIPQLTYNIEYLPYDSEDIEFERKLTKDLDPFVPMTLLSTNVDIILAAKSPKEDDPPFVLVSTNENGGYAATGYYLYKNDQGIVQWRLNPFRFFKKAFATSNLPKPDTTTLQGRRIFYAHIDGDGWRSLSLVPKYKEQNQNCAKVILEEVIKRYPQLPITVSPIAADLDTDYFGSKELQDEAREIFAYEQVSVGSHTYTHPLYWKYYEDSNATEKEKIQFGESKDKVQFVDNQREIKNKIGHGHEIPRSYIYGEFNLTKELLGSVEFIQQLLPQNKKVSLFQWSGDCTPFEKALRILREKNILNLNGGNCRFDPEFPSYAFVSPIGRFEKNECQIYASNNNETTYTNNWTNRFFGYRYLVNTFESTGKPIRIKPYNIYFHMYSAEKLASLRALLDNIAYVLQQEMIPITAKHFATIGNGFLSTNFEKIEDNLWRIKNRGSLNTIRFDEASLLEIDWTKSKGVIGQRHSQGNLYIALDKRSKEPIIALKEATDIPVFPSKSAQIYVINSRWRLWNIEEKPEGINFIAQGFGIGEMTWQCPQEGTYQIQGYRADGQLFTYEAKVGSDRILKANIKENAIKPIALTLTRKEYQE